MNSQRSCEINATGLTTARELRTAGHRVLVGRQPMLAINTAPRDSVGYFCAGTKDNLEEVLLGADFGVPTTLALVDKIGGYAQKGFIRTESEFQDALVRLVEAELREGNSDPALLVATERPTVILVIGVNGAGKTTTLGKLAAYFKARGHKVRVAAADTFRAAASDQLDCWGCLGSRV